MVKVLLEVKLGLIMFGIILCFVNFGRFMQTSLYEQIRDVVQWLIKLNPYIDIDSSTLIIIVVAGLIALISLHAIASDNPSTPRRLFYLALSLFIPTVLPVSRLRIATLLFPISLTTDVPIHEIIGHGVLIGCGLILCVIYSEHVSLCNDLISRGIHGWENAIRRNLLFSFSIVLLSGFVAFLLGLVYIYLINFASFLAELSPLHILAMLMIALTLGAASLWYIAKSGSLKHAHSSPPESR